jgi:hypothetical protein
VRSQTYLDSANSVKQNDKSGYAIDSKATPQRVYSALTRHSRALTISHTKQN